MSATLLGGCTAGVVVDSSFQPLPVGKGALTFVGVDANGVPNNNELVYTFIGDKSVNGAEVIFDDLAPDTMANASGLRNSKQPIPVGSYYVHLDIETGATSGSGGGNGSNGKNYVSGIFQHQYDGSCNDGITGQTDQFCEQYYFEVGQCAAGDSTCCYGDRGCALSTLPTHEGTKVILLLPE